MTTAKKLEKAKLIEMEPDFANPKSGGKSTTVQFNPESLKVTFANQLVQPGNGGANGTGDQSNQAGRQFVGAGTTKLALQLWFDVGSQDAESGDKKADVRDLTKDVAFFITPTQEGTNYLPPAVRFSWGSFHFDGYVDSLDENLDFFSEDGIPLRASVSLNMSQQKIQEFSGSGGQLGNSPPGSPGFGKGGLGTTPLVAVRAGASLQAMVGAGQDWKKVAEANNIENPRSLDPGALINLNLRTGSSRG
jgi:hypothetical protein